MKTSSARIRKHLGPVVLAATSLLLVASSASATPPPTETLVPAPTQWFPPTSTPTAAPPVQPTPSTPPREVVLTAPKKGATVVSPVEVEGRVSVMPCEANLRGRVYDDQGRVVGEAPMQVRPDMEGDLGGPSAFSGAILFEVDATCPGYVEVAEISAWDGSIVVSATLTVALTTGTSTVVP